MSGEVPGDWRSLAADVRALALEGLPDRHETRAIAYGRLLVGGVYTLTLGHLEDVRSTIDSFDDESNMLPDLLAAQAWTIGDDGVVRGPSVAPPLSAPMPFETVAALAGGPRGDPAPAAAPDLVAQLDAVDQYETWLARVRAPGYWLACQARRAWLFGRLYLPADPRELADVVRRHRRVAGGGEVDGERAIDLYWSAEALRLDYDVLRRRRTAA